jgi:hypothetical protein
VGRRRVIGYSVRIRELNRKANKKSLGVQLGKHCIEKNIPVSHIVDVMGVSKQTVYNWFTGVHEPHQSYAPQMQAILLT